MVGISVNRPGVGNVSNAPALFPDDVPFGKRILKQAGFFDGAFDGRWTPEAEQAAQAFLQSYNQIKQELGTFDPRSEAQLRTLLPATQRAARAFLTRARDGLGGFEVKILSGTRTYAEQNALYEKGRSRPGPRVTNARGGQSNHNFGIAFDIGIFQNGRFLEGNNAAEERVYKQLAQVAGEGLEWGGNWRSFPDQPHYQLALGQTVSQLREKLEAGVRYT